MTTGARIRAAAVAAVVLLLVAGTAVSWWRGGPEPVRVSADFEDTTGLYVGNDVEYLGVPVGEVVRIEPRGTHMRVHLELEPGTEVPRDAGAVILQSALVTDRYVELGPAYTGGPTLSSGAHIAADHTRSPATIDEVTASIDELVRALDSAGPGERDIGDLLAVGASTLDGNGRRIRDALVGGERALRTLNARGGDIEAVVGNLAALTRALAERDTTIRGFADAVGRSTRAVARQRSSITTTLRSLAELGRIVTRFVRRNHAVAGADLRQALRVARTVRTRQDQLAEAFDTMPTLAENLARAYDWERDRLRVQFSTSAGPFSRVFRAEMCDRLGLPLCGMLFHDDGTGLLDPLLDGLHDVLPENIP
ncbi:MCE family protein [Nocardioides ferulae]|uniref:MCE family protein n=1 Tax=Nocardioides ferulae TaxID=2340821 RepID=UPI000EAF12F9|nr:MCE family protein [Nocardioides ferulae]